MDKILRINYLVEIWNKMVLENLDAWRIRGCLAHPWILGASNGYLAHPNCPVLLLMLEGGLFGYLAHPVMPGASDWMRDASDDTWRIGFRQRRNVEVN